MNWIITSFRRRRKEVRLLFILMIFAVFLSELPMIVRDNMEEYYYRNLLYAYGDWDFSYLSGSEEEVSLLLKSGQVSAAGEMAIYADVLDRSGEPIAGLGTISEEMKETGYLSLREGGWPKDADEIAVESTVLSYLGYSFDLGQEIKIRIRKAEEDDEDAEPMERTYRLCGILEDYTSDWPGQGEYSSLVISEEEAGNLHGIPVQNSFFQIRGGAEASAVVEGFRTAREEGTDAYIYTGRFVENHERKLEDGLLSYFYLLQIFVAASVLIVVYAGYRGYMKGRRASQYILRCIGAKKGLIYVQSIAEALCLMASSVLCGSVLAVTAGAVCMGLFTWWSGLEWFYILRLGTVSSGVEEVCAAFLAAVAAAIVGASSTALIQNTKELSGKALRHLRNGNPFCGAGMRYVAGRERKLDRKDRYVSWLLGIGVLAVSAISLSRCGETWESYLGMKERWPMDYATRMEYENYDAFQCGLTEEMLGRLRNIYGVKRIVMACKVYDCYQPSLLEISAEQKPQLFWDGQEESQYYQYSCRSMWPDILLYGIARDSEGWEELFGDRIDWDEADPAAYDAGDEVLVFVPDIVPPVPPDDYDGERSLMASWYERVPQEEGGVAEDSIEPGETLTIVLNGITRQVNVGAVIHTWEDNPVAEKLVWFTVGGEQYHVIGSPAFLDSFSGTGEAGYNYVAVQASDEANYTATTKQVSRVYAEGGLSYYSVRETLNRLKRAAVQDAVINGVLVMLLFAVWFCIRYQMESAEFDRRRQKIRIWKVLGMKDRQIKGMYLRRTLRTVSAAFVPVMLFSLQIYSALLTVLGYQEYVVNTQRDNILKAAKGLPVTEVQGLWTQIQQDWMYQWRHPPAWAVILLGIVFIAGSMGVTCLAMRESSK